MSSYEFECKMQRSSRLARSLSKDRAQFKKQAVVSYGRKQSAAPTGSDSAHPHRAARVATRTCLAKGAITASADMPKISMGHAGYWVRWVRKPSVPKLGNFAIEELDVDDSFMEDLWDNDTDDAAVAFPESMNGPAIHLDIDVNDQKLFPPLDPTRTTLAANSHFGAWTTTLERELIPEEKTEDIEPEDSIANDQAYTEEAQLEPMEDWVLVSSNDAEAESSTSMVASAAFDAQHPRKMFAKNIAPKPKSDSEHALSSIDWSRSGMPTQLLRQLIRSSANAAHQSVYSEKKITPLPMHVMRAQSSGSSKRQNSTPKTPRSQSKPRAMRQSSGRH